jgi:hypothetical protein
MPTMLAAVWHIKISRTDLGKVGRRVQQAKTALIAADQCAARTAA